MKINWTTKIIIIIAVLLIGGFLAQTGIYYYKIKTGKITAESFENKFTYAKNLPASPAAAPKASEIINTSAPYFGASNPELTIIEFGNFACNFSQEASPVAREVMLKYKDKIKFIYRDFPLDDIYPGSSNLSLAGKCAGAQGKFWAFHDKLYQAPKSDPTTIATQIGLDKNLFSDCLSKQKYGADVQKDFNDGYKNGVAGTPTFFFIKKGAENNPIKLQGAVPRDIFQQTIEELLK